MRRVASRQICSGSSRRGLQTTRRRRLRLRANLLLFQAMQPAIARLDSPATFISVADCLCASRHAERGDAM
jgi:hypothetical protein